MGSRTLTVADVMKRALKTVRADSTLAEIIEILADEHVTGLPVVESNGSVIGVVTTTDLLQVEAEHSDKSERTMLFEQTLARDIMTPEPKTIAPHTPLRAAAQRLLELEVHRLFVEEDGQLVGVVSQTDIVRALATGQL